MPGDTSNPIGVSGEGIGEGIPLGRPDTHGLVVAGGGQHIACGAKGNLIYPVPVG